MAIAVALGIQPELDEIASLAPVVYVWLVPAVAAVGVFIILLCMRILTRDLIGLNHHNLYDLLPREYLDDILDISEILSLLSSRGASAPTSQKRPMF